MNLIHRFFAGYYAMLLEDCLDQELKGDLSRKIKYHESKIGT